MHTFNRLLSTLLLIAATVPAVAQAEAPREISQLLEDQILNALDLHRISGRTLVLVIAEAEANATSELSSAINRQRTDLQMGTTSDSPNAISVLEKPGIADLLSLALDRGAITKTATGTGLTLSTTPYAIITGFGARDTPQLWKKAVVARSLAFSATFSSTEVTEGDFSSFTSGEVKYVIIGNRSPRDPALLGGVRAKLGATFLVADDIFDKECSDILKSPSIERAEPEINSWLEENHTATAAEVRAHLNEVVGGIKVNQESLAKCVDAIQQGEQAISGGLDAVTNATRAYLADHRNQFSVATLFIRDSMLSDYYVGKLLYGHDFGFAPVTVNLNAEASWNQNSKTAAGMAIHSLRAYSVELGLNSKTFANGRLDGSVASKASRDEATDAKSVVVAEAKLSVHLNDVMRLPITFTYANRETREIKKGWQLNVGVSSLLDDVLRRFK